MNEILITIKKEDLNREKLLISKYQGCDFDNPFKEYLTTLQRGHIDCLKNLNLLTQEELQKFEERQIYEQEQS